MRRMTRLVGVVVVAVMATASVPGGVAAQRAAADTLAVPGLTQPVEVIRDRWGLNHIYAQNETDLFLAQGYLAAKDRLFQFEVWRRRATGTVAEILGPRELDRDIGTRLHMYRGDMDAELNHYHPRGKAIVEAYVRGVNAYVDEAMRDPASLPVEFKMLGITPGKWTPQVVISRHQALTSNVPNEATHVRAIGALGSAAKLRELLLIEGGEPPLTLDPLIDPKTFPADVLKVYDAFRDPIDFAPGDVAAAFRAPARAAAGMPTRPPSASATAGTDRRHRHRIEQLGDQRRPRPEHAPDHGQRPAPGDRGAVAALLGAPGRAGLERDRRRRAGAARRVDRPQRVRRLGAHDLRFRQRGPVRLRNQSGQPERVPLPGQLGGDAGGRRHGAGEGPAGRQGRAEVHAARAGAVTKTAPTDAPMRCGRRGWRPAARRIWPACG